ncbi:NAD(P)-binding protein [Clavulina sp. PMI_390]|nr:NAD(P)-binding protein [Clavulina sp. PMI_390]
MPSLSDVKAKNSAVSFPYRPVALVVGGTSGIGQAIATALARYTRGNIHIIICGRNKSAAEKVIASFPTTATSKYEFLECDASKLRNVAASCKVLQQERGVSKLNYLVLSPGYFARKAPFYDNGEGLDEFACLAFYSRFKFVHELLPLLQAAKNLGEEARVLTILAAGRGNAVDMDHIGFKKEYPSFGSTSEAPTYSSAAVEAFAKRNPRLSFTHSSPGLVDTPLKPPEGILWAVGNWLVSPLKISAADCAEWQSFVLLGPATISGAFHVDSHADEIPAGKLHLSDEVNDSIYGHLMSTFEDQK